MLTGLHPARHGIRTNDGFRLGRRRADPRRGAARRAATPPAPSSAAHRCRRPSVSLAASIATTTISCAPPAPSSARRTKSSARRLRGSISTAPSRSSPGCTCSIRIRPTLRRRRLPPPIAGAPYDGEVAYTDAAIGRLFEHLQRSGSLLPRRHPRRRRPWRVARRARRAHARHVSLRRDGARAADRQAARRRRPRARSTVAGRDGRSGADDRGAGGRGARRRRRPEPAAARHGRMPRRRSGSARVRRVRTTRTSCSAGARCAPCGRRRWKFIEAPRPELYDLESDPGELRNRVNDRAGLAAGLQRALPAPRGDA